MDTTKEKEVCEICGSELKLYIDDFEGCTKKYCPYCDEKPSSC